MDDFHYSVDRTRRSLLKYAGLLGLGMVSCGLLHAETAEAVLFNKREYKVTRTGTAMGTSVSITAIHPSRDEAEKAIWLAFEEIDRLQGMLTHHDPCSPIGKLNTAGRLEHVPLEVKEVISGSLDYHRETGGAFDITIKPLLDLYKNGFGDNKQPINHEIEQALKLVDANRVYFRDGALEYGLGEMAITLDGIAKGYIVDKVSEVLMKNGVSNHLINAGGDIRVSGTAEKNRPWNIAIQDPDKSAEYPDVVRMNAGGIATSGNYEIFFDQEKLHHHIIDSRSGSSPLSLAGVTVIAPTVMDADALATSVFVMGPQRGKQFINNRLSCECLLIGRDNSTYRSTGWQV
ncbi:MAG TPA: FAD:protein FMN transferase [Deltaproteobacteria bacterium]|nr:FAD:protein FMN transferase [Deltaproteobacteria bacterium]